jgi:hypothetical protein
MDLTAVTVVPQGCAPLVPARVAGRICALARAASLGPGTGLDSAPDGVAFLRPHLAGQSQHVAALLAGDSDLAVGEHPGHVLQRQAVLADIGHV